MGDSITEGTLQKWLKGKGDYVKTDEVVARIETDKIEVEIRAPKAGVITEIFTEAASTLYVGSELFKLDTTGVPSSTAAVPSSTPAVPSSTPAMPTSTAQVSSSVPPKTVVVPSIPQAASSVTQIQSGTTRAPVKREHKEQMNRVRMRIAERLKYSQNTYAMLTTFNEIDMSALSTMRNKYKDEFQEKHGVKLGFMSCFVKAATVALREQPVVNAVIDGTEIIHRDFVDISVAVATPKGLVVPVIRDCDTLSFASIEKTIHHLGLKARDGQIAIEDMQGGTFTISNGGVYGSLFGTPIINPPQSAILGMHAINKRAVVVNDQIVARPVMVVALTYDHRLIDGREAVTFLKKIKDIVEDPTRLLLDL